MVIIKVQCDLFITKFGVNTFISASDNHKIILLTTNFIDGTGGLSKGKIIVRTVIY